MNVAIVNTNDVLTAGETAAALDLSVNSVRKYCQRGLIHGIKAGREWLVSKSEIRRFKTHRRGRGRPPTKS